MAQTEQMKTSKEKSNTVNFRPLGNRILARRLENEEKMRGGIIIPDTAKKKQEQAEVIAVGVGKKDKAGALIPMGVKVGDVVLMDKYSGQEITLNDIEYVIVRADDLIAIIEK